MEGKIDALSAAEVKEITRNEHGTTPPAANADKYLACKALRLMTHGFHVRKTMTYFIEIQAKIGSNPADGAVELNRATLKRLVIPARESFRRLVSAGHR